MRSSEKNFSKRNCTHHQRHRRRHPVPFPILTCVRQPQRLQHRLPSRNHQGAAVSDCRLIEGDFRVAHLETHKPERLDGVSPYRFVLARISLVGRRSEEPQKDNSLSTRNDRKTLNREGRLPTQHRLEADTTLLYRRILAVGRNCFSNRCEPPFASVRG